MITTHHIRKVHLSIRLRDTREAFWIHRRLERCLRDELSQKLDLVFSNYADPDETIRIDRLSLAIGSLSKKDLEKDFLRSVEEALQKYFSPLQTESYNRAADHEEKLLSAAATLQKPEASLLEAISYFLVHGILPWWKREVRWEIFEEEIITAASADGNFLTEAITESQFQNEYAIKRFIRQFSHRIQKELFATVHETFYDWLLQLFIEMEKREKGKNLQIDSLFQVLRIYSLESAVHFHFSGVNKIILRTLREFEDALIEKNPLQVTTIWELTQQLALESFQFFKLQAPSREFLSALFLPETGQSVKNQSELLHEEYQDEITDGDSGSGDKDLIKEIRKSRGRKERSVKVSPENEIYVQNAGLVILHPFIANLFGAVFITDEQKHLNESAAIKGICLLQFLASGKLEFHEHDLVLNKILCGVAIDEPADTKITLTQEEQDEGIHLLEAVVTHWQALRNSSPEGLRNTFLLRGGKISREEEHWLLQVERTGFDILIDRLPWSISRIKLPWMKSWLRVEWNS